MSSDPTNIWAWVYPDKRRLKKEGGEKGAIADGYERFEHYRHNDDAAADHAISSAVEAARATGELRWELFLRHWRLQLWLDHDLTRVLPEAVDLLSMATDERLRDVPQRICAFHDLVDCHVRIDAAGYYEDIVANARDVLAQLPERHSCATCARMNVAIAAGTAGHAEEAEQWMARLVAHLHQPKSSWSAWSINFGEIYEMLGKWPEAEREYAQAIKDAQKSEQGDSHLEALLGRIRMRVKQGEVAEAAHALRQARHFAKYATGTYLLARLLETEGWVAEALGERKIALDYFTRAAKQYLELGRYRLAALTGLHAAEQTHESHLEGADEALTLAAQAVGAMPPASQDVYQRLQRLGRQPIQPAPSDAETRDGQSFARDNGSQQPGLLEKTEQAALEDTLTAHMTNGNIRGVAMALYRLGRWYALHEQPRAALDYLISNAILERLLQLPMDDREDALHILTSLQEKLPPGTIAAALAAAERGPSALLAPLLGEMPAKRWRWLMQSVAADLAEKPAVEPEPEEDGQGHGFNAWLEHVASMTALIVRFRERTDLERCERWAEGLGETAAEIEAHLGPEGQGREPATLARGLAALARGASPEEVAQQVLPPFNEVIEQITAIAEEPVWRHPGSTPLDFLVEQAAQRAVRALRMQDEHRQSRLANLAWRFELMSLDLQEHKQLQPIEQFMQALGTLLLADAATPPAIDPPLQEPFATILAAIHEAGRQAAAEPE